MTTDDIHVLHGVEFRRNPEWQSGWEFRNGSDWAPVSGTFPTHRVIVGVLEERFPKPRTVTLDNGDVWTKQDDGHWAGPHTGGRPSHTLAVALDTLDRIQNGDPDDQ